MIGKKNNLKRIDRKSIRRKYGIHEKQKIVLYLPFPVRFNTSNEKRTAFRHAFVGIYCNMIKLYKTQNMHIGLKIYIESILQRINSIIMILKNHESRKYLMKRYNEPRLFKTLKTFCTNNNLILIVKPRLKYQITDYVRNNSDICISDDEKQQYPSILQELFSISDLTIGHFSVAAFESISFGVPYLNIETSNIKFLNIAHRSLFSTDDNSMFNYRSSVYNWTVSKFISDFKKMSIDDFKMKSKDRIGYMEKFLGPVNGTSAHRFYEYLEHNNQKI